MKLKAELIEDVKRNIFADSKKHITPESLINVFISVIENLVGSEDIDKIKSPFYSGVGENSIESNSNQALGESSVAEGKHNYSKNASEISQGQFNKSTKNSTVFGDSKNTIYSLGIGTSNENRKNAIEVMQNGDIYIIGLGGYDGMNAGCDGVKTLQQVLTD